MKKTLGLILILFICVSMSSVVFAENQAAGEQKSRSAPYVFFVFDLMSPGGASKKSAAVTKEDYTAAWISRLTGISADHNCAFRIRRNSDDASCSALYVRSTNDSFNIYYDTGMGVSGTSYRLWGSAPSSNIGSTSVTGRFAP
ncbi:MAG: hypothetical protein IKX09_00840 [Oscillospiraceae bacterium]|nr:hypothetical protein [Oscillospiraceae bacterium]